MDKDRSSNILGICVGGPSGAALFQDGKLVYAVNEERLTKNKLDRSHPYNSINWCLNEAGLSPDDIETICYGFSNGMEQGDFTTSLFERLREYSTDLESMKIIIDRLRIESGTDYKKRLEFREKISKDFPNASLYTCGHHQAHQACAYMASPFENALVVTSDGRGDFESFTISTAKSGEIKKLYSAFSWESLGYFYGRMTHLCGFKPERHEGKLLGLSARGNPMVAKELIEKMVGVEDGKIKTSPGDFYRPFFSIYPAALQKEVAKYTREDLAAATQAKLEEIVSEVVSHHVKQTNLGNICLAGGVFTNVKLNQRLRELPGVKDVFVYPNMGDDGLCAGAVYHKLLTEGMPSRPISSLYLGPNISNETLVKKLISKGFQVKRPEKLLDEVVDLLSKNKVVAIVQGRAEFGPRALGNRSLLLTPNSPELSTSLNNRLHRNDFMPFAPAIASNLANRCLKGYSDSQFSSRHMVITYNVTNEFRRNSPAVVHLDGTVRPQLVFKEDNPLFFEMLNRWHKKTGRLSLINTSYNMHEDPIASTEDDVVSTFEAGSADHLLFPPFLAYQKEDLSDVKE